ncbi:MAG: hypothetical protein RLZZ175_2482 [Bacteroidota bacterium]|jgi:hypothetical protein
MSLYICILYLFFIIVNFVTPWKVISISKIFSSLYFVMLLVSFVLFSLLQMINLIFHEGTLKYESVSEIYPVYFIQFLIIITLSELFLFNFKLYNSEQKNKNLKAEWNRLSNWTIY